MLEVERGRRATRKDASTARQAISLAQVRLDESEGSSGVTVDNALLFDTPVFAAVDAAVASDDVPAPKLSAPASLAHYGVAEAPGSGGSLAFFFAGSGVPETLVSVDDGAKVGFFFHSIGADAGRRFFARLRTDDGRHSPASEITTIASDALDYASEPTLEYDEQGSVLRACGGVEGNQMVFFVPGTEIAVGFAAAEVGDDGCAELATADIPEGYAGFNFVLHVDAERRVSRPSESVFY